jgi:hypothetical protein
MDDSSHLVEPIPKMAADPTRMDTRLKAPYRMPHGSKGFRDVKRKPFNVEFADDEDIHVGFFSQTARLILAQFSGNHGQSIASTILINAVYG